MERKGLLTLLARDIEMYEKQWEVFEKDPSWVVRAPDYLLSTKVWEDVRSTLWHLLEVDEYVDMIRLFQNINILQEMRHRPDLYPEFVAGVPPGDTAAFGRAVVRVKSGVPQLKKQTAVAKKHIHKYVSEDDLKGSLEGGLRPLT